MIQRKEARMAGPNWASIGTLPTGGSNWVPHVAQTIDGHLEVFTLDSQGALWHTRQITPNGHWNPWALVAHPPTNQVGRFPTGNHCQCRWASGGLYLRRRRRP